MPGALLEQLQESNHNVQTQCDSDAQVSLKGSPVQRAPAAILGWRLQPAGDAQQLCSQHLVVCAAALFPRLGIPVGLICCLRSV